MQVIGGNIATAAAAIGWRRPGLMAIKVGIGPGSICTTRIVSRHRGAADKCHRQCHRGARGHGNSSGAASGFPGYRQAGRGARGLMGSMFAGTEGARRGRTLPGRTQGPGHGITGGVAGPRARPKFSGCAQGRGETGARGNRGQGALQGAGLGHRPPADGGVRSPWLPVAALSMPCAPCPEFGG